MMTVECSSGLNRLEPIPANQVVIRDRFGHPLLVALVVGDNQIMIEKAGANNPNFATLLQAIGIGNPRITAVEMSSDDLVLEL